MELDTLERNIQELRNRYQNFKGEAVQKNKIALKLLRAQEQKLILLKSNLAS
jgi:hypothetical protein